MGGFGMGTGYMGGFGWIFMLLFWALVIVGLVALVKWIAGNRGSSSDESSTRERDALAILQERYARGEIEREEFVTRKQDLEK